jgi:hypothetical protein
MNSVYCLCLFNGQQLMWILKSMFMFPVIEAIDVQGVIFSGIIHAIFGNRRIRIRDETNSIFLKFRHQVVVELFFGVHQQLESYCAAQELLKYLPSS